MYKNMFETKGQTNKFRNVIFIEISLIGGNLFNTADTEADFLTWQSVLGQILFGDVLITLLVLRAATHFDLY